MVARRIRKEKSYNYWPSFVDVLSTLLIVILFMLLVFILAHFFLGRNLDSKNSQIDVLQKKIYLLGSELSLERRMAADLSERLKNESKKARDAAQENDRLTRRISELTADADGAKNEALYLSAQAESLKAELARLSGLLAQSEALSKAQEAQIVDLGKKLNRALAQKVSELAYYRSDFFGRLRKILQDNDNVEIVGDRFVFQSELFFKSGSAQLERDGKRRLDALAQVLLEISAQIPENINWIVRIDGHTDNVPVHNDKFGSNWELSSARALSVVYYLKEKGVPEKRMAAAGFGEFHPIAKGNSPKARRKNRRIEFKLTEK